MTLLFASAAFVGLLSQSPAASAPPAPVPTPAIVAPENPFRRLFPNLGEDLKALGSADTAWIAGFGGATALAIHNNNDERLHSWVLEQGAAPGSASVGNFLGNGFVQGGAAVAVWAAGRSSQNVRIENTGADLIRAQILNGVLTQAIKFGANRTRPDGGSNSFPSGHTSATFATAAVIQHDYGALASAPFYALGTFVGWSRIRSNHHWLSDTVAGAALGIIASRADTRHHPSRWMVTPVKTRGGAALYVTRR